MAIARAAAASVAAAAVRPPKRLSLKHFMDFGSDKRFATETNSCVFLRSELPVRLRFILKLLEEMEPVELLHTQGARQVREWYSTSLGEVSAFGKEDFKAAERRSGTPGTSELARKFTETVAAMVKRHDPVIVTMADACQELKRMPQFAHSFPRALHLNLEAFYTRRIGIRMLAQQHLELFRRNEHPDAVRRNWVGVIDSKCDPAEVAYAAAVDAKQLCELTYAVSPNFTIDLPTGKVSFAYIPAHLYHVIFELMKNSFRATVEAYSNSDRPMPPVRIVIVKGQEDLTIKICDEGKGIPRSGMPHIFSFMYSTAPPPSPYNDSPLAGYGFGLPLSRVYCRYFDGDLRVISTEGYGTDAYVYLKRLPSEAGEVLVSKPLTLDVPIQRAPEIPLGDIPNVQPVEVRT